MAFISAFFALEIANVRYRHHWQNTQQEASASGQSAGGINYEEKAGLFNYMWLDEVE